MTMSRRKTGTCVFLCCVLLLGWCILGDRIVMMIVKLDDSMGTTELAKNERNDYMQERILFKVDQCNKLKTDDMLPALKRFKILYSKEYNISYCNVGKAGSTFMKQIFTVLSNRTELVENVESMSRSRIHLQAGVHARYNKAGRWKSRLIAVARDPYTRLFSSYVDKTMLPSYRGIRREIRGSDCLLNVTFEEYLDFIVKGKAKMAHFSPIYDLCKVCIVPYAFIVKLENFTRDITYVLDTIHVEGEPRRILDQKLHQTRDIWSITSFVKEVMQESGTAFLRPGCVGWIGVIQRLWLALQFQGHISEAVALPLYQYKNKAEYSNVTKFLEIVFETIAKHPLTKEEIKAQRRRALVRHYNEVDRDVLERVKQKYRPDFEIFGYSKDPPQ